MEASDRNNCLREFRDVLINENAEDNSLSGSFVFEAPKQTGRGEENNSPIGDSAKSVMKSFNGVRVRYL